LGCHLFGNPTFFGIFWVAKEPQPIIYEYTMGFAIALPFYELAFGTGYGSELRRPLGIAIVGGLMVSQLLTLYTTPVVYLYMNQFQSFCRRLLSCFNPHSTSSVEDSRRRIEVGGLFLPVNEAVTVKDNDTRVSLSLLNILLKGQQGTR